MLLTFISACCNNSRKIDYNDTYIRVDSLEFIPSWEMPFTKSLDHYKYALSYWHKYLGSEYVSHFPTQLEKCNNYSFYFIPGIMQLGSRIELKIQFSSKKDAMKFFETSSKNYSVERINHDSLYYSYYCIEDSFASDTSFQFNNIDLIRLIHPTWCASQGEKKLGGITSSIYLDRHKNIIFCTATDGRL